MSTKREIGPKVRMNILAVDDEENVRNLYATVLGEEGYRVVTASSGAEAIEKVKKEELDLIILDLKMPDMHGTEVLREIREVIDGISVIIVTAYPSLESSIEAIKVGVYDYIIKPFSPKQLRLVAKRVAEKIGLVREKERLLKKLEEKNKRLEENVDELENIANVAMIREKDLKNKIKELEAELKK
ncbi:MAG: response regulator [Candidatus Omnitrophica bacterium]|nr:response regulator [Candidatus Omnitrophota bacterium]